MISEAVHLEKPDRRIFERALTDMGCRASETWFVGDDPFNDVLGATAAGLRAIWLTGVRPWPANHSVPHWQIAALDELIDLVRSRQKRAKYASG